MNNYLPIVRVIHCMLQRCSWLHNKLSGCLIMLKNTDCTAGCVVFTRNESKSAAQMRSSLSGTAHSAHLRVSLLIGKRFPTCSFSIFQAVEIIFLSVHLFFSLLCHTVPFSFKHKAWSLKSKSIPCPWNKCKKQK